MGFTHKRSALDELSAKGQIPRLLILIFYKINMTKRDTKEFFKVIIVVLFLGALLLTFIPTYIIYISIILIVVVAVYVYKKRGLEPFRSLGKSIIDASKKIETKNRIEGRVPPLSQAQKEECIRLVGNRCCYPHCRETISLDVHHIVPRAESGSNKHSNLIVLCDNHHKLADRGAIPRERLKHYSVANVKGIR